VKRLSKLALAFVVFFVAAPPAANAGPTEWDVGLGWGLGAFGVQGDYAETQRAEGGWLMRVPLHVRVRDWEVESELQFAGGAADNQSYDEWGYGGFGFHGKRYFTLSHRRYGRDTGLHIETYLRGSAAKIEFDRPEREWVWGYGYGTGLQVRLQGGSKHRLKASFAFWMDVGRIHIGAGATDGAPRRSRIQTISFGITMLGLGR
jgi:hypothetical protein